VQNSFLIYTDSHALPVYNPAAVLRTSVIAVVKEGLNDRQVDQRPTLHYGNYNTEQNQC